MPPPSPLPNRPADHFLDEPRKCVLACVTFERRNSYFKLQTYISGQSGAVAQLGARVNGIHEVAGSIPASSTKT
jgi:hypothetical protein